MHGPSPLESSAQSARAIAHSVLGDVAHVQDEVAYMLQAKTFASLELTSKIGLPRAAFDMWFVDDRTTRHAIFPPGWLARILQQLKPDWRTRIEFGSLLPGEVLASRADIRKAADELSFSARWTLEEGLADMLSRTG